MADLDRSRLRRAWSLSRLGAKVALQQGKRLAARDEGAVHAALAKTLVAELGGLKGLPMKVGQILSYMDGVVPAEYEAIYQDALAELRTVSEPMAEDAWRAVFEAELGEPPEALFERFDPEPIAAASIGQVHRARFEGVEVCVKVQYPGIEEATKSDLSNLDALVAVIRRVMPRVDTRQMIEDFRDRLAEECDYRVEADYQRRFAALYETDASVVVPAVIDARSTTRVLTTRFVSGVTYERFLEDATAAERDDAGRTLFRFAFGSLLGAGLFHADPHPGNLLFRADGGSALGVLDYGCVQPIAEDARADIAQLLLAAMDGRELLEPTTRALGLTALDEGSAEATVAIVREVLRPITSGSSFRFTPEFAKGIGAAVIDAKKRLALRYVTRRGRFVAERPGVMFVVRNLFGLASIWAALGSEGDYAALTREMIESMG